jgi:hypothetical protein
MLRAIFLATTCFAGLFALLPGCMQHGETNGPTSGPEANCADACRAHAPSCTDSQCARGCRVMLDRLVEREQPRLIACVARSSAKQCDESIFADCAARVGPFADGGPPPPKAPSDDDSP